MIISRDDLMRVLSEINEALECGDCEKIASIIRRTASGSRPRFDWRARYEDIKKASDELMIIYSGHYKNKQGHIINNAYYEAKRKFKDARHASGNELWEALELIKKYADKYGEIE
jgi:hypothetical protein